MHILGAFAGQVHLHDRIHLHDINLYLIKSCIHVLRAFAGWVPLHDRISYMIGNFI
jgi:hypothetical protein